MKQELTRQALKKRNLTYYVWRFVENGRRSYRAMTTRRSYADTAAIAHELTTQGIVVDSSERFLTEDGRQALREASDEILRTYSEQREQIERQAASSDDRKKAFLVHLASNEDRIAADHPLLRLGLDPKLLEIVSSHLGLWPVLHSLDAWLNIPTDAPPAVSQLWHRDPEDLRIVKVFIYLVDVDDRCGPFSFVPGTHAFGFAAGTAHKYEKSKRLSDDQLSRVFAPEQWRVCTGPAGTMILSDTTGYHRGGKPAAGHRILITFTFTSGARLAGRAIRIAGTPTWFSAPIQASALPGRRRPVEKGSRRERAKA
jgi:hypothetical protein